MLYLLASSLGIIIGVLVTRIYFDSKIAYGVLTVYTHDDGEPLIGLKIVPECKEVIHKIDRIEFVIKHERITLD